MKSHVYQCNICLNQLFCTLEPDGKVWSGVGIGRRIKAGHQSLVITPVELSDGHLCGHCISGLRSLFSLEAMSCLESATGNSASSGS